MTFSPSLFFIYYNHSTTPLRNIFHISTPSITLENTMISATPSVKDTFYLCSSLKNIIVHAYCMLKTLEMCFHGRVKFTGRQSLLIAPICLLNPFQKISPTLHKQFAFTSLKSCGECVPHREKHERLFLLPVTARSPARPPHGHTHRLIQRGTFLTSNLNPANSALQCVGSYGKQLR